MLLPARLLAPPTRFDAFCGCQSVNLTTYLRLALSPQGFLVTGGNDVGDNQNEDHQVEGGLLDGVDFEPENLHVRKVASF